jgi:ubiquinone/menaquinone biosynthesis C-methylase UbiE
MLLNRRRLLGLLVLLLPVSTLLAQQAAVVSDAPLPAALKDYKGRRIARTMHFTGAEWLIRDSREREERCSLMITNLGVKPGMTVCDMGCGNGFYSLQLAKMVGSEGKVLAVDIQPEMLTLLETRATDAGLSNIKPTHGTVIDPKLPAGEVDLILCVDVYHEFSHPEHMLAGMRQSLAPGGVIVLVEYREEDPEVPIKPLHKMSKKQIMKELPANGFKLVREFEELPWQHMMFFGADEKSETGKKS